MSDAKIDKKVENADSDQKSQKPDQKSQKPDQKEELKYAVLQETNGEEYESWLYFIKYNGNEKALEFLQSQLEQVDWKIIDDNSTFDLELKFLVSEKTAKEMTMVDLNHCSFHRKFDGELKMIDFKFKPKHSNNKKIRKVFDMLGKGLIEDFIDNEDVDPNDLVEVSSSSEDSSSEDSSEDSKESEDSEDSKEEKDAPKKKGTLPGVLIKKIKEKQNDQREKEERNEKQKKANRGSRKNVK